MEKRKFVQRWMGEETLVILDLETGQYYSLNWTAGVMWDIFYRGGTVVDATVKLQELVKNVDPDNLSLDVQEFADELVKVSLLANNNNDDIPSDIFSENVDSSIDIKLKSDKIYEKPSIQRREALHSVTAGTYDSSYYYYSGGGGYTYYYYYYYYY